jgi:hypothetical protein
MDANRRTPPRPRTCPWFLPFLAVCCVLLPLTAASQGLTGALIGTVSDEQGAVLQGALVRVASPALIGGAITLTTNERGHVRFPALPPGVYSREDDPSTGDVRSPNRFDRVTPSRNNPAYWDVRVLHTRTNSQGPNTQLRGKRRRPALERTPRDIRATQHRSQRMGRA